MLEKRNRIFDFVFCVFGLLYITFLVLKNKFYVNLDGDIAAQSYALYSFVGRCLHNGELPLWNPYLWSGETNIGLMITQAFYPINWILCYIFYDVSNQFVGFEIIIYGLIIHIFIYFSGLYFLLKKINVKSYFAFLISLLAISSFSFSNYWAWTSYLYGFSWFPYIILTTIILSQTNSHKKNIFTIIILGFEFGMVALIGAGSVLIWEAIFAVILYYFCLIKYNNIKDYTKVNLFKIIIAGIVGVLLSSPVLFSNYQFILKSLRFVPDLGFINTKEKVSYTVYLQHKVEDFNVLFSMIPTKHFFSIQGIITLFMIIGMFSNGNENNNTSIKKIFSWFICIFILLGYTIFITNFVYYIPLINSMREMYMYGIFYNLFSAIIAGYGITFVFNNKDNTKKLSINILFFITLFLAYNIIPNKYIAKSVYLICILCFIAFILIYCGKKILIAKICLCIACLLSLYKYVRIFNVLNFSGAQAIEKINTTNIINNEEFSKIKKQLQINNSEKTIVWGNAVYPTNQGIVLGVRETINYANPISTFAINPHLKYALDKRTQLQNIKYFICNENNDSSLLGWLSATMQPIDEKYIFDLSWSTNEKSTALIFKNKTFGPGWFVTDYELYTDDNSAIDWVNNPDTKLNEKVIINKNLLTKVSQKQLDNIKSEPLVSNVDVTSFKNNTIIYNTYNNVNAILITAETYNSGWKVYIDGKKQNVLNVDYSNRGVIVPAGNHVVKFVYRPTTFLIGIICQVMCIIFIVITTTYFIFHKEIKNEVRK